jgi:hypothetical protein
MQVAAPRRLLLVLELELVPVLVLPVLGQCL